MRPSRSFLHWLTLFVACCGLLRLGETKTAAQASEFKVSTRDELIAAVRRAVPGTTILIAPGTYRGGLTFADLHGERDKPIVLAGADQRDPPVIEGGANCIHLSHPRYVELRDLVLADATGNGLNVDDGGNRGVPARGIVLRRLQVRDIGPRGNRDGIKLSGVDEFLVEDCSLQRWGDGGSAIDMVGCHKGRIIDCEFRFQSDIMGNGVQTKGGSSEIVISRCRFEDAGSRSVNLGGSTGRAYFRPRDPGYEARDITVEDCTFIGSMAPIAFVGVDGATVRHNTIYRPTRWVIRILQESRGADFVPCRNGTFSNNVVVFRSDEVRTIVNVGEGTAPETFTFSGNHWFCSDNPQRSNRLDLPVEESGGRYGQNPRFVDVAQRDFRFQPSSPVRDAGVRPRENE
jgi:hypothetical protein